MSTLCHKKFISPFPLLGALVGKLLVGKNQFVGPFPLFGALEGQGNLVTSYIHAGGKIGVLVEAQCAVLDDTARIVAKDLCMQVAASQPRFVRREEVTPEILESEKEILE